MSDEPTDPETFWASILSEDETLILAAFRSVNAEEQEAVRQHLSRMSQEDGWAEVQRTAALAALRVIAAEG